MAQKNRRQRRLEQSKQARAQRTQDAQRGRSGSGPRRERRRRRAVWAAVAVLVVVIAGITLPLVLTSSSPAPRALAHGTASGPRLSSHTLLELPAASAVAQQGGVGWVTDDLRNLLLRFDPATGKVEHSVHLAGRPVAMVLAGGQLWVADAVDNEVVEVDPATLTIERSVAVPAGPTSLAALDGDVWVSSLQANEVTPIDVQTGVAGTPDVVLAGAVRVAAGFGSLWVTGTTDLLTRATPLDDLTGLRQQTVTVGQGPIGVATGRGMVWVANAAGGTVSAVSPSALSVTQTLQVGGDPLTVAVSAGMVYVGDGTAQTVRTVAPVPKSQALVVHTGPRVLVPVAGDVWVGGSNPGRVVEVTRGMSGSVERFFEHLSARDWESLRGELAPEVVRIGPLGDRVAGRDRYLAMLESAVPADYGNDVHLVTYADHGRAAFARVTEHLGYPNETLHLEEAYTFGLDDGGQVNRIEVFWQTPKDDPAADSPEQQRW